MNESEDNYSPTKVKMLLALWLSLPLSSFISSLLVFTCQWLLRKCLFFFLFFVCYLHVIAFRCLVVLHWNESNLLSDSGAILPAIMLIHSGQWILMTMKSGSCEEILWALVLVTPSWPPQSLPHLPPFTFSLIYMQNFFPPLHLVL